MRAVVFDKPGGPEVLREADLPEPLPGPGDVRLRVAACALNHLDLWVRRGLVGNSISLPHVGGSDVAGWVDAVGEGADAPPLGTPVMAAPGISCGICPACREDRDPLCPDFRILGFQIPGGFAEKCVVPARNLLVLPEEGPLSVGDWAAFPLVFTTAWNMLVEKARLRPGETVLVQGAGSGVGSAAVQVARDLGARVFAVAGTDWKLKEAAKLGAEAGVNHRTEDVLEAVRRLTGGRGVDVVFEHVGGEIFEKSFKCLARGGRLVTCGATGGGEASLNLRALFAKNLTVAGNYMGSLAGLREAFRRAREGRLRPVVGRRFPLSQLAEAQACMEERNFFGKIVVDVAPPSRF